MGCRNGLVSPQWYKLQFTVKVPDSYHTRYPNIGMGLLTTLKIFRTQLNEHSKWAATIIDQSAVSASAFRARASK